MKGRDYWVEKFLEEALPKIREAFNPSQVIVFGSRAQGRGGEGSDLDVIVVADSFCGVPFLKRMPMLLKLVRFEKHIDFLCYTEEEFEQAKETSSIVKSALKEGRVIMDGGVVTVRGGEEDGHRR
ncbi:nucleotidyltransferase domain-containing protein [Candidatus Bipolaricaulota bacterium]|nr:nucleotidyltransferase domain-containing protein [Candidatus Bipolaricaulota bacterium]